MFLLNLCLEYSRYLDLIDEEVYQSKVDIQNVHPKSSYDILKLKSNNFEFFANIEKLSGRKELGQRAHSHLAT